MKRKFIDYATRVSYGLVTIVIIVCGIFFAFKREFVQHYFMLEGGYVLLVFIIIYAMIIVSIKEIYSKNFTKGFDDIKDLVRGTIIVEEIDQLFDAY